MVINGAGTAATGVTLLVVLVAKFTEGAWVTMLLIPGMLFVFVGVRRHYRVVARELAYPRPLDVSDLHEPIIVVPISAWNKTANKALRLAIKISSDIYAVQVRSAEGMDDLQTQWGQFVATPTARAGLPVPQLVVIDSPYRRTLQPIIDYVLQVRDRHPDRQIAVIIPELVESRWYQYFLHNQRAEGLKALLLFHGGQRVVVINVPWYLSGA
jgi:hypothetical protein